MSQNFASKGDVETISAEAASAIKNRLTITPALPPPTAALLGETRLLIALQFGYTLGGIYQCQEASTGTYGWVLISTADVDLSNYETSWTGSKADWAEKTDEERANYKIVRFNDDPAGTAVFGRVADGDHNAVDGDAVYRSVNAARQEAEQKQDETLETPLTIGGTSQTTVEGALGGLSGLIPSGASASNKLVTESESDLLTIPISKFQIGSGGAVGYADLGATTTTTSQAFSWLEVEYGRVDGFIDKYFITVAGSSSDLNYIKVVRLTNYGQTPTITLDANKHIWMSMDTYVYIRVKAYGNFSISGTLSRTAPTGTTVPINRLVTESDISEVAGYIGQYDMSGGHSLTMRMDSTAFRRVTIYNHDTMYSFVVHEWGAQPKYHWIVGTALPSDITLSYENYALTIKNTGSGMYRACIEAPKNPVSAAT